MDKAKADPGEWLGPSEGNTRRVDGAHGAENERRHAQDGRDNSDQVAVDLEPGNEAPDGTALQGARDQQPGAEETEES